MEEVIVYARTRYSAAARENNRRRTAQYRLDNPKHSQNSHLVAKYGITVEKYDELLIKQNSVCAICGNPETAKSRTGNIRLLSVDHDHTTGAVRGLLCVSCNTAVGGHERGLAIRIEAYLKEHSKGDLA
jgi:hypothetical protein